MPFVLGNIIDTTPEIHVGESGTVFISTIYDQNEELVDVSTATSIVFRFYSPSRVSTDKTASLYTDGTDGKISYILESDLFDESGKWKYSAIVTFAAGTWHSNAVEFKVYPILPAPPAP